MLSLVLITHYIFILNPLNNYDTLLRKVLNLVLLMFLENGSTSTPALCNKLRYSLSPSSNHTLSYSSFSLNCSLYSLFSQIVLTMFQDNGSTSTTALCDRLSKMLSPSANRTYSSTLSENSASTLHEERLFLSRLFLFAKDKMSVKFGKCAYKLKANSAFVIFFI